MDAPYPLRHRCAKAEVGSNPYCPKTRSRTLKQLVAEAEAALTVQGRCTIGIGTPGSLSRSSGPDIVVLGGGLSIVDRLYERLPALWGSWAFTDRVDTRLARPATEE